jgi:hypothetical protein
VYRRCGCQDPNSGRAMGARCPRLAAERSHGSWYLRLELGAGTDGRRRRVRRGGLTEYRRRVRLRGGRRGNAAMPPSRQGRCRVLSLAPAISWAPGWPQVGPRRDRRRARPVAFALVREGGARGTRTHNPRIKSAALALFVRCPTTQVPAPEMSQLDCQAAAQIRGRGARGQARRDPAAGSGRPADPWPAHVLGQKMGKTNVRAECYSRQDLVRRRR